MTDFKFSLCARIETKSVNNFRSLGENLAFSLGFACCTNLFGQEEKIPRKECPFLILFWTGKKDRKNNHDKLN